MAYFLDVAVLSDSQPSIYRGIGALFWMLDFLEGFPCRNVDIYG
jgi:hypothetical protein